VLETFNTGGKCLYSREKEKYKLLTLQSRAHLKQNAIFSRGYEGRNDFNCKFMSGYFSVSRKVYEKEIRILLRVSKMLICSLTFATLRC
jgi:hypothetical protein